MTDVQNWHFTLHSLQLKSNLSTLTHYLSSPLVSHPAEEDECLLLLSDLLDWFRPVFRLKTRFTVTACSLSSLLQLVTCAYIRARSAPGFCSLPDLWPLSAGLDVTYKMKSKSAAVAPFLSFLSRLLYFYTYEAFFCIWWETKNTVNRLVNHTSLFFS